MLDRAIGGVGISRGRRDNREICPGDALDLWRVIDVEQQKRLLLSAEMKLPGEAVLFFELRPLDGDQTELRQIARFLPRGLLGLAYWYSVTPFHNFVFDGMLRGIAKAAKTRIIKGPERFKEKDPQGSTR
jgi:hypothetical protein